MKIKSVSFVLLLLITFVIVFLMNYIGNPSVNAFQSAIMNGFAGAVGMFFGMFIYQKTKQDKTPPPDFD